MVKAPILQEGIDRNLWVWEQPDYDEEQDEFMRHFDEHGNFIEKLPDEIDENEQTDDIKINYIYKPKQDKEA